MSVKGIVLVSQVFHPDEQATSQLLSGLLSVLGKRGVACAVYCGFPVGGRPALRAVGRCENWQGVSVQRGGFRINGKRSLLARALGYVSYCMWITWRLIFHTPNDARVVVVTNPPFAPILVYWCSLLKGWKYDVMLHDVYPDGLVGLGKVSDRSPVTKLWRWFNRGAFASAHTVFVIGRDMARLVEVRYGVPPWKIAYSPNWSPYVAGSRQAAETTKLWRQLRLDGQFVVQYSGNMGLWHDIECIVRAAELLCDEPHVTFLMIGDGRRRRNAELLSKNVGARNIMWLPYQPQDELADSLACCHVALVSQRAELEGVAVPSKLYGILASGRAVLAQVPVGSEVALVLTEEGCGITTEPGDPRALAETIRMLARDPSTVENLGRQAFEAYQAKYTVQSAVDRFERFFTRDVATAG